MSQHEMIDWKLRTAVVIASGPSLSDQQLELIGCARLMDRVRVITVNNTAERACEADVHYIGDYQCAKHYYPKLQGMCQGQWWTADLAVAERWKFQRIRPASKPGLGLERIHLNGNSGAQAVNLATLFGAKRILLVGFDMREVDGLAHWFGQHPQGTGLVQRQLFEEWLHKWEPMAADAKARGIVIVNCTPGSALRCVPQGALGDWL